MTDQTTSQPLDLAATSSAGWIAILADRDGFAYTDFTAAAEELFDESEVTISVVRGTAQPTMDEDGGVRAAASYYVSDVAYEVDAYMVDPDDESVSAAARWAQAQAMAAGLNNADELAELRTRLGAAGQLVDAVRTWARDLEDTGPAALAARPDRDLYDAWEQHRVLTLALDHADGAKGGESR